MGKLLNRLRLSLLAGALALGGATFGCDPDLPGRACSIDDDCFRDELCQGTSCVRGERDPDPEPDGGAAPDTGPDAESG